MTFDEELTPIQIDLAQGDNKIDFPDRRKHATRELYRTHNLYTSSRKYGYISLNNEPVFYYLHFTLQEILDALKI